MRYTTIIPVLVILASITPTSAADNVPPATLPRYGLDLKVDVDGHRVAVSQTVRWTNTSRVAATKVVLNVHSHFPPPNNFVDYLFLAKMLEILRVPGSQGLYQHNPFVLKRAWIPGARETDDRVAVPARFDNAMPTALEVEIPRPVGPGESISFGLDFEFDLPQKQGRWGQWKGVTFLSNWHPVVAFHDDTGWHPTPFVAWHQPFFNEAGEYEVRVRIPSDQVPVGSAVIARNADIGGGVREVVFEPTTARDFSFFCSNRFREFVAEKPVAGVTIKCIAFAEHEFYAKAIVGISSRALERYTQWFGRYPTREFRFVESYFGWNGNECSNLVMIDERVFSMPEYAEGYVEYLVSHETCHQWFYNVIGTDGYRETFMDEAFATFFAHKHLNALRGQNNKFLDFPKGLRWLPNIERENYRYSTFFNTLGRGELGPTVQEMEKYKHVGNLFSAVYDRGSKIVGLVEDRMGETAFLDFMRTIYRKYYFRVIRVDDFRRELEEYTGRSWDDFFKEWIRSNRMADWSVDGVEIQPLSGKPTLLPASIRDVFGTAPAGPVRAVVYVKQSAEQNEPTTIGFSFDGDGEKFTLRVPVRPGSSRMRMTDPPGSIDTLPDGRIRVEIELPQAPTQIAVDPDLVIPDSNPGNNYWKTRVKFRATPLYTFIDESALTTPFDRWTIIAGPWTYGPSYADAWYLRSNVLGARIGAFRSEVFTGGFYTGYRSDYRDIAVGFDGLFANPLMPKTELGIHGETSVLKLGNDSTQLDRLTVWHRYIFDETASLYNAPIRHAEVFGSYQHDFLPEARKRIAGSQVFDSLTQVGAHFHADYLTPYWDPEIGFRYDATYAAGLPVFGQSRTTHQFYQDLSVVQPLPDSLGWLKHTRVAVHLWGAATTDRDAMLFTLGGTNRFRGFDLKERQGSLVWGSSFEWRVPVLRDREDDILDHTAGLRNLYLVPFYDIGDAYVSGKSYGPVAHALGMGFRADVTVFSFIERATLRLDVAKTIGQSAPLQFWIGVSHPF